MSLVRFSAVLSTALIALVTLDFGVDAQTPAAAKRTTVSALRSKYTPPAKSQFETEAEYLARSRQSPRGSFLIRVPQIACGRRLTALGYDAESGSVVLRILGEARFFEEVLGASNRFEFSYLKKGAPEAEALVVWERCSVEYETQIPMTNAFGATISVKRSSIRGSGVLVPRAVLDPDDIGWKLAVPMGRNDARKLISRYSSLTTLIEVCLLPDEDGMIVVTGTDYIAPKLASPIEQMITLDMVRASIRVVHLADPSTGSIVLSLSLSKSFCD